MLQKQKLSIKRAMNNRITAANKGWRQACLTLKRKFRFEIPVRTQSGKTLCAYFLTIHNKIE